MASGEIGAGFSDDPPQVQRPVLKPETFGKTFYTIIQIYADYQRYRLGAIGTEMGYTDATTTAKITVYQITKAVLQLLAVALAGM